MNPQNPPNPSSPAGDGDFGGGATETRGALAETKNKLAQTARDAASKVKAVASTTATKARDQAERLVSEKKETTANRIGGYSSAIHESAKSLEENDPNIAWFTHRAADKLQNVADYMRNSDFAGLRGDCENFARRNPAVFFGGLFFVGLMIGNVVKASQNNASRREGNEQDAGLDRDETQQDDVRPGALPEYSDAERNSAGP